MALSAKVTLVMVMVVAFVSSSEAEVESGIADWIQNQPWPPQWIPCDYAALPGASCQDCNTRLICTPVGGLLKPCGSAFRPYCNNGLCTSTQSSACAEPEETTTEDVTNVE